MTNPINFGFTSVNVFLKNVYPNSSFMAQYSTDCGSLMAAAGLATIPTIIFFFFAQKYMVKGVVAGAVKG